MFVLGHHLLFFFFFFRLLGSGFWLGAQRTRDTPRGTETQRDGTGGSKQGRLVAFVLALCCFVWLCVGDGDERMKEKTKQTKAQKQGNERESRGRKEWRS